MGKLRLPQTIEEFQAIEPKNVTFGRYNFNSTQENVLNAVIMAIQEHMSKTKKIPRDLFNQPYVEIDTSLLGKGNNKHFVLQEIKGMIGKLFEFRWVHPEIHKTIDTSGTFITTAHSVKETSKIYVNFNLWCIPFLLYYGKGVGGTVFSPLITFHLKSEFSKRIYKIICSYKDKGVYIYKINDLIKDFMLTGTMVENKNIKRKIFEKAKKQIDESGSSITFDFEFAFRGQKPEGKKPKSNVVVLHIHDSNRKKKPDSIEGAHMYQFVFSVLNGVWPSLVSDKAMRIADRITESGFLEKIYYRFQELKAKYDKMHDSPTEPFSKEKYHNTIKLILWEDYGIK